MRLLLEAVRGVQLIGKKRRTSRKTQNRHFWEKMHKDMCVDARINERVPRKIETEHHAVSENNDDDEDNNEY